MYSDACAADGGRRNEFTVLLKGVAEDVLIRSLLRTREIYGLEAFADVAAGLA